MLVATTSTPYDDAMANTPFSEQLRAAVLRSDKTRYRIAQETGIPEGNLSRFVNQGAGLSLASIDKLCECLGLNLTEPETKTTRKGKRNG